LWITENQIFHLKYSFGYQIYCPLNSAAGSCLTARPSSYAPLEQWIGTTD